MIEGLGLSSAIPSGLINEVGLSALIDEDFPGACHSQNIKQLIDLKDVLLEDSYQDEANGEESCMFTGSVSIINCPLMDKEEYILSVMGPARDHSLYIPYMYSYTDERGDHFMVAAIIGSLNNNSGNE